MKIFFLPLLLLISLAAFISKKNNSTALSTTEVNRITYKKQFALACSPDLSSLQFEDSANLIPLLEGWGNYRMPVTQSNDSSGIYFQQGINMYYGFHIIEALASFQKSTTFDSSFAMGYWGIALAYGPNINDIEYAVSPLAITAVNKAKELSGNCTPLEKELIGAMQLRYSTDTSLEREKLDQSYADAMEKVHLNFPKSADAAALYVDALLVQHPWDLYTKEYQPKPWTPKIVNTLESLLKTSPNHPGASHYYIHAIEASAHPEKGVSVANNLHRLMPGVAHVVHMPSHIYIRSGYYDLGVRVNEQAVKSYYNYASRFSPVTNNTALYLIHNLHMQATCANMDGSFKKAMKASIDCKESLDSNWLNIPGFMGVYVQYIYETPLLTLIRFGKWEEIFKTPPPPPSRVYANLLWHYAQGLAYARKHQFDKALVELEALTEGLTIDQMKAPAPSYANPAIAGAGVAQKILQGVIEEEKDNLQAASRYLYEAVVLEDSMVYNEPKDWVHPARQYLGRVLLKERKYAEAIKVYQGDLEVNPNNGWSLTGLANAYTLQGQKSKAAEVKQQAAKAFSRKDLPIEVSAF